MDHFSDLVREREAQIHEVRRIECEIRERVTAECLAAAHKRGRSAFKRHNRHAIFFAEEARLNHAQQNPSNRKPQEISPGSSMSRGISSIKPRKALQRLRCEGQ